MSPSPVRNISDTARWVAAYRALESAQPDALFNDHLAARLAGERGRAIANATSEHSQWALITRTRLIDDLVLQGINRGVDCVLNLAAGFDTRPYRLPLPAELLWIEADLAPLLEEKEELLRDETPRCKLERARVDLADSMARSRFFETVNGRAQRILAITEGLVIYLETTQATELAGAIAAMSNVTHWIVDFSSPELVSTMQSQMSDTLVQAPFKLEATGGVTLFEGFGWHADQVFSLLKEAGRFHRLPFMLRPFALLPQPDPRRTQGRWSVVAQYRRATG